MNKRDKTPEEMVEYAEHVAEDMLQDMDDEEAIVMVREFCRTMAEWQPQIAESSDNPVMLGIHCLATAHLFQKAFVKAYSYTDRKLDAVSALKKAFNEEGTK